MCLQTRLHTVIFRLTSSQLRVQGLVPVAATSQTNQQSINKVASIINSWRIKQCGLTPIKRWRATRGRRIRNSLFSSIRITWTPMASCPMALGARATAPGSLGRHRTPTRTVANHSRINFWTSRIHRWSSSLCTTAARAQLASRCNRNTTQSRTIASPCRAWKIRRLRSSLATGTRYTIGSRSQSRSKSRA